MLIINKYEHFYIFTLGSGLAMIHHAQDFDSNFLQTDETIMEMFTIMHSIMSGENQTITKQQLVLELQDLGILQSLSQP